MPTLSHRLVKWAEVSPQAPAQRYKSNGEWRTITAREFSDRVYQIALFLRAHGMQAGQVAAIFSYNLPQWTHTELAVVLLKAMTAGLYPNSNSKDVQYILNNTQASVLAVQNREYFEKIVGAQGENPLPEFVQLILVFEGDASFHPKAISWENALGEGRKLAEKEGPAGYQALLAALEPTGPAFLIYTSGTTGNPKGAMLSQDNLAFTADVASEVWKLPMARGSMFSFLPLCHIAEKIQSTGVGISQRYTVSFCSKFENVSNELPDVSPAMLLAVPRVWEKMMEGVQNKVRATTGVKRKLMDWALDIGARVAADRFGGRSPHPLDLAQLKLADKLVLSKIRAALGLKHAETLASGAAALAPHVSKWFRSIGLEIVEDYGQTESTGVVCMTEVGVESAGTVGKPVPHTEFKLAPDGEILTRGRHVFIGYFKDDAATKATLVDGWLHTGDLGEFTETGLLRIRGRKKEILKTSGGKMIAPGPLEDKLKASDLISQVCIVGDGRKFLSALITLSEQELARVAKSAAGSSNAGAGEASAIEDPQILAAVGKTIEDLNRELASYEQIKRFTVLNREFSIAEGEMTPTLKMKRNVVEKRFQKLIDAMYGQSGEG